MLRLALALLAAAPASGAGCNGEATPGPRNNHSIDTAAPVFVRSVENGKLYSVGTGDDARDLVHLWGSPYDNGVALGQLLGDKVTAFMNETYAYFDASLAEQVCGRRPFFSPSWARVPSSGLCIVSDPSRRRLASGPSSPSLHCL